MAIFPATLLERVYVPGSLRNNDQGFELALKNRLAPTTLVGVGPLQIDEQVFDDNHISFYLERPAEGRRRPPPEPKVWAAADMDKKKANLAFGVNAVLRLLVSGRPLAAGNHEIACSLRTREVGEIVVKAVDHLVG